MKHRPRLPEQDDLLRPRLVDMIDRRHELVKLAALIDWEAFEREGGMPLKLAFCWAHGRRKLIVAKPKKGSPIVEEALLRIAALYKVEDSIRGSNPDQRHEARQTLSRPLADAFFTWLAAQAARVSRKSDLGEAMAYMLKRQNGFRLFLDDGKVDMDSNLVENAIRSPAMNRRNALFAGHDEGGRNWARFASLIGTCKMNGIEPYAYLRDLFTRMANGHLEKDIDALMPWAHIPPAKASQWTHPGLPDELIGLGPTAKNAECNRKFNGPQTPLTLIRLATINYCEVDELLAHIGISVRHPATFDFEVDMATLEKIAIAARLDPKTVGSLVFPPMSQAEAL